jgi:O-antigen/teichoic acid export membrane protein
MENVAKKGFLTTLVLYSASFLGMLNSIFRTKVISVEEIGVIAIITTLTGLGIVLVNFGINAAFFKYYSRLREKSERAGFLLVCFFFPILALIPSSILFNCFKVDIGGAYDSALVSNYLFLVVFMVLGEVLCEKCRILLELEAKSVLATILNEFWWRLFHLLFLVLMLFLGFSFVSYLWLILGLIYFRLFLLVLFGLYRLDNVFYLKFSFNKIFYKEFFKYTSFMFLSGFAGVLTVSIDKLMLGEMVDVASVGLYAIAFTLVRVLNVIGIGFAKPNIPLIAKYWNEGKYEEIKTIYSNNVNQMLYIGGGVLIGLVYFGNNVLAFLGEEYKTAYWALVFLSIGEFINIATGLCGTIISFSKHFRFDFWARLFLAVLTIMSNLMLIPLYGINGAALASMLSLVIYNLLKVLFLLYKFNLSPYSVESVKILSLTTIAFLFCYLVKGIVSENLILMMLSYTIAICLVLFLDTKVVKTKLMTSLKIKKFIK